MLDEFALGKLKKYQHTRMDVLGKAHNCLSGKERYYEAAYISPMGFRSDVISCFKDMPRMTEAENLGCSIGWVDLEGLRNRNRFWNDVEKMFNRIQC